MSHTELDTRNGCVFGSHIVVQAGHIAVVAVQIRNDRIKRRPFRQVVSVAKCVLVGVSVNSPVHGSAVIRGIDRTGTHLVLKA